MAQDAELKLKVSLDLAFFRQQISTISTQLAGQAVQLNVQFNKKSITDQYRLLDRHFGRKTFKVKVESNTLDTLVEKVAKFKENLQKLEKESVKLNVEIESKIKGQDAADARRNLIASITGQKGAVFIPIEVKPPLTKNINAIRKDIKDRLSGIVVEIEAKLKGAAGLGQATGGASKEAAGKRPSFLDSPAYQAELQKIAKANAQSLAKAAATLPSGRNRQEVERLLQAFQAQNPQGASRSSALGAIRELIARGRYQQGLGFEASLQPIRGQRQTSAPRSMPNLNQMLDRIANLTENPRAAQRMLRMMPENRLTTDLIGAANRQAAFKEAGPGKFLDLRGKAFDPLLKAIAESFTDYTKSVNASNPWVGKIGGGITQLIGRALTQSPEQMFGGKAPVAGAKLLPAAGQSSASRMTRQMFAGLPPLQAPGIGIENAPLSRAATYMLNKANRALGLPIGPSSPLGSRGQFPMSGMMGRGSMGQFPMDDYLAIGGPSAMGQARAGSTPWLNTLRGSTGFFPHIKSSFRFPMNGMMGPSSPLTINAQSSMFGGGGGAVPPGGGGGFGGMGGLGGFGRAMGGMGNLPGAGTIKELGGEFAFATKQVLLFGQAYKLLAFAQDFPAQVSAAVSQLQSFRNTLLSVTGSAGAAADANEFILAAVEKYSIPLQSARDGFTKLFASMEPAGFAAGEIQNLFLGISKAAATYGMSADKVDRVNYAFAQMASKGQVMSEELKGQLGDVLPGAMGIFAKAAGFEGPDAIQKFGKALEDGEYKGGKMRELLRNVANEMNKEFGPGAEGAARTFQGAINRMQTATAKLYESLEPAAIGVMNAVMVPFVQTLKNATDGINAYFSGQEAATPAAQVFADILKTLVPTLTGIGENLKYVFQQVTVLIQGFGAFALQVGRLLALPIVRYLAGAYVQTLLLTTAFKALATSGLGAALAAIARFIAQGVVYAQVTLGMRVATQQTTVAMYQFGTAVQTVMIKSVIGIALVAIGALIAKFVELQNAMASVSGQSKQMQDAAKASAKLGDVAGVKEAIGNMEDRVQTYKRLKGQLDKVIGDEKTYGFYREIPSALAGELMSLGLIVESSMKKVGAGYKVKIGDLRDAYNLATKNVSEFNKAVDSSQDLVGQAQKKNQQLQQQGITGAETPDEAALKKAQQAAEKAANQQQQLAMDAAKRQNDLDKARFEHLITMNESDFDHWKSLQDDKFNYEIAGMNSIEARQRKFQKDLQDIEIRRIETIRKAELETAKAVQESQAAARVSAAAGGGVTGLYQGSTGISSGAHFDIRRADRSRITEAEARALLDPSVSRQLQMTSGYGRRVPPVPGASSFHAGIDLAGPANTPLNLAPGYSLQGVGLEGGLGYTANVRGPQGEMYKVGHLQPPGASYTRQRRAEGAGGKQDVTQVNATYKATEQLTNVQNAYDLALKQTATTIKSNVASIFPVAELQLETSLMKIRNQLQLQGMPAEYIKYKEELFKAEYEAAEAVKNHQENISEFERTRDAYTKKQQEGVELTAKERQELDYLNKQIALNKEGMAALTEQQKAYNIAALESAIATMKQADALKAMEEVSGRINDAVEGVTDTYKSMFKEIAMGGDSVEALKKAQQALADQFLTMVFDMAMKPVEESMKNTLSKMFGVPTEKEKREESIKKMEEQLTQLKLIEANTAVTAGKVPASGATPSTAPVPGQTTAAGTTGGFLTGTAALQTLPFDGQTSGMLQTLPFNGESGFLSSLGINSEDMAASMAESAGAFSEQLGKVDASVFESANALGTAGTELGKEGAAGKKWHESLGQAVGGLGMAAGAVMGIVAGINQIKEGGTSNVLGGIGMIASMAGSLLGSFGGLFGGGAGASSIVQGVDMPVSQMPAGMAFANGGIAFGGFRAFANGGTVSGPTLGLVGEGKYNEAVVPLPDGRSIPVQLGGRSARDMMGGNAPGMPQAPSLSMKFETTKINGVEYVSREQLEQAMAETRRASIAGGAQRGMSMTLDKIKQSPSTRSSIGIR